MIFPFLRHLQFKQYRIQLRLEQPVWFHYFHGPALNGLLCSALNCHPLGPQIVLYPVESGRIGFGKGDLYNFGLTLIGDCPDLAGQIRERLAERGRSATEGKTFGMFSVTAFESCEMTAEPETIPDDITLQFVTPLRMERKQGTRGKQFFDAEHFDAQRFLRLLYDRAYDLCKLSATDDLPAFTVPELPIVPEPETSLLWIDAPYHGLSKTFGGVVGLVQLNLAKADDWKRLLWWGQHIHVGRNSAFGFGRYLLNPGTPACAPTNVKPAKSILDRMVEPGNLMEAFYHCKHNQGMPGSDGQSIEDFESELFKNMDDLVRSVRDKTYHSKPLMCFNPTELSNQEKPLAVPALSDRILQLAAAQILEPAWNILWEENSVTYRKGLNSAGATKAMARAYDHGYRYTLKIKLDAFYDSVNWKDLEGKLRILLLDDPIIETIIESVNQDFLYEGESIKRTSGLHSGAEISNLLTSLFLIEIDNSLPDGFKLISNGQDYEVLCKSKQQVCDEYEKIMVTLSKNQDQPQSQQEPIPQQWLTHCDLESMQPLKPVADRIVTVRSSKRRSNGGTLRKNHKRIGKQK